MSKNCLNCTHFLRTVTYLCNGRGYILGMEQTRTCTKGVYRFKPQDIQKIDDKIHYKPHKFCEGTYFMEIPDVKLPNSASFDDELFGKVDD